MCSYKPSHKENPYPSHLTGDFYQTFIEEIIPYLHNFLKKIKAQSTFQATL